MAEMKLRFLPGEPARGAGFPGPFAKLKTVAHVAQADMGREAIWPKVSWWLGQQEQTFFPLTTRILATPPRSPGHRISDITCPVQRRLSPQWI